MATEPTNFKIVSENRRARHDYAIEDTLEAGIVLQGSEVKSLRLGRATLTESFAGRQGDELYLFNAYIPDYQSQVTFGHETRRPRKLLVHKNEMRRLLAAIGREGMTLVPLAIQFNARGIAKVRLGIAKGRKTVDKRHAIKEREWQREKARTLRERNRG